MSQKTGELFYFVFKNGSRVILGRSVCLDSDTHNNTESEGCRKLCKIVNEESISFGLSSLRTPSKKCIKTKTNCYMGSYLSDVANEITFSTNVCIDKLLLSAHNFTFLI